MNKLNFNIIFCLHSSSYFHLARKRTKRQARPPTPDKNNLVAELNHKQPKDADKYLE